MPADKKQSDPKTQPQTSAQMWDKHTSGQTNYREQALALFPHVCARCCREFSGKRLRELTVHHKDNDHLNNPRDGSNWELLCLYCHDDAHEAYERTGSYRVSTVYSDNDSSTGSQLFGGLKNLLKPGDEPDSK